MEPRFRFRLYLLTALILVGAGMLLTRLYKFQIEDRDYHRQRVPGTRTVTIREPGVRGDITDRNGIVLAENVPNYDLIFNLEEIRRHWKLQHADAPDGESEAAEFEIGDIVAESIVPRLRHHGIEPVYSKSAIKSHFLTHGGLVPYTFPVDLDFEQFSRLAEHNLEMPGVYVTARPRRQYPYGSLASHLLGYLKQWGKGDIPKDAERSYDHYLGEDDGIMGIEATMDQELKGPPGKRSLLKNEKGHVLGLVDYVPPGQGSQVELTIDAKMQYLAENALRRAGRAAAVVMDTNTGEILVMASVPDYDPNDFIPSIATADYQSYRANLASPFTNRCIASFTPGSTFKLPTAVTACLHGRSNHRHNCVGSISYGRNWSVQIRCWKRTGHGTLDFPSAIQRSCNPFFMDLANRLGTQAMVDGFQLIGFGRKTGVRLPSESPGIVPGSNWWKREYRPGSSMTPSLLAQLAIGQGDSEATPLQMCALVACIANGGTYYQPRLVRRVIHPDRGITRANVPIMKVDLLREGIKRDDLEIVRRGMWRAANEVGGTARRASLSEVAVAAKTGTAQTSDMGQKSHNAWTVAFAPFDSPRYAVAVVVQNGKSGGKVAGPIVNLILRGLFGQDGGRELPLDPMKIYAGNFDPIEEIVLLEGDLVPLAIDEEGETGEEAAEAEPSAAPAIKVRPKAIPLPTITPEADPEPSPGTKRRKLPRKRR
jgi:penicillin-binding protein 2